MVTQGKAVHSLCILPTPTFLGRSPLAAGQMMRAPPLLLLLALTAVPATGWAACELHALARPCTHLRTRAVRLQLSNDGAFKPAAATGEDCEKTDGIPNYMIRTSGTVAKLAACGCCKPEDGVLYEEGREVSIVTSDVIEMVQQQGGAAEFLTSLGEDVLVNGLLFDDFQASDTFEMSDGDVVCKLEIVEARLSSALELSELGSDESKKQGITSFLSLAPGFSGWTAKVVEAGRVKAGFEIAKRVEEKKEDAE